MKKVHGGRIPEYFDRIVGSGGSATERPNDHTTLPESVVEVIGKRGRARMTKRAEKRVEHEDIQLFQVAATHIADYVQAHGGHPREFSPDMLHIVARYSPLDGETERGGSFYPWKGHVTVIQDTQVNKLDVMVHELLHYASFHSLIADERDQRKDVGHADIRRAGIRARYGKEAVSNDRVSFFDDLDEGITATCEMEIMKSVMRDPAVQPLFRASEELKLLLTATLATGNSSNEKVMADVFFIHDAQTILDAIRQDGSTKKLRALFAAAKARGDVSEFGRVAERKQLHTLIDKMFLKGKGKFVSRDEIFNLFTAAQFSGRLLPLARAMEETLGEGAFRKIGEQTGSPRIKKQFERNIFKRALNTLQRWWNS